MLQHSSGSVPFPFRHEMTHTLMSTTIISGRCLALDSYCSLPHYNRKPFTCWKVDTYESTASSADTLGLVENKSKSAVPACLACRFAEMIWCERIYRLREDWSLHWLYHHTTMQIRICSASIKALPQVQERI